jgi:formamidopyrimidine-DNA glycosylase
MIELPEAVVLARQMNQILPNALISHVTPNHSPHKFAWFHDDPEEYRTLLIGKTFIQARYKAGMVETQWDEDTILLFAEGVNLRFFGPGKTAPDKHQLLIQFSDGRILCASVQMYGGLWAFRAGMFDNPYYRLAQERNNPFSSGFSESYWFDLICREDVQNLSVKAFLATDQRIPGLGNGVLQDILFRARIHPKTKVRDISDPTRHTLFHSVKETVKEMAEKDGRDTEKDLFGEKGRYATRMSRNTLGTPCSICSSPIQKSQYLGGTIYFCPICQKPI